MVPAQLVCGCNKDFQGSIASTGAHARQARVDAVTAFLDGDDRVGNAEAQVVMRVDTGVSRRIEHRFHGAEARTNVIHIHRAAGVDDVNAGGTVAFHQFCLLREPFGGLHVAHHQEANRVHAKLTGVFDVLLGDVCLGAMGGDTNNASARGIGCFEVVQSTDAWEQQRCNLGVLHCVGGSFDPLDIGVRAKAVVEAGALKAVTMRDLDRVDLGGIQCTSDGLDLFQ
ncbi:hypothetical protein D9M73_158970 [compost metagenome]